MVAVLWQAAFCMKGRSKHLSQCECLYVLEYLHNVETPDTGPKHC